MCNSTQAVPNSGWNWETWNSEKTKKVAPPYLPPVIFNSVKGMSNFYFTTFHSLTCNFKTCLPKTMEIKEQISMWPDLLGPPLHSDQSLHKNPEMENFDRTVTAK